MFHDKYETISTSTRKDWESLHTVPIKSLSILENVYLIYGSSYYYFTNSKKSEKNGEGKGKGNNCSTTWKSKKRFRKIVRIWKNEERRNAEEQEPSLRKPLHLARHLHLVDGPYALPSIFVSCGCCLMYVATQQYNENTQQCQFELYCKNERHDCERGGN